MILIPRLNRARIALAHDTVMAAISFPLALYLRLGDAFFPYTQDFLIPGTLGFAAIAMTVFLVGKMYRGIWRYASVDDLLTITKTVTLSILIFLQFFLFNAIRSYAEVSASHSLVSIDGFVRGRAFAIDYSKTATSNICSNDLIIVVFR